MSPETRVDQAPEHFAEAWFTRERETVSCAKSYLPGIFLSVRYIREFGARDKISATEKNVRFSFFAINHLLWKRTYTVSNDSHVFHQRHIFVAVHYFLCLYYLTILHNFHEKKDTRQSVGRILQVNLGNEYVVKDSKMRRGIPQVRFPCFST